MILRAERAFQNCESCGRPAPFCDAIGQHGCIVTGWCAEHLPDWARKAYELAPIDLDEQTIAEMVDYSDETDLDRLFLEWMLDPEDGDA